MDIPIQNIYYLWCYAYNPLNKQAWNRVHIVPGTGLHEMFASLLIDVVTVILKRGLHQSYKEEILSVPGIKGKLLYSDTLKSNSLAVRKTVCSVDEFSPDVIENQVIAASLQRLLKSEGVSNDAKSKLLVLRRSFGETAEIVLDRSTFKLLHLSPDKLYRYALNICEFIFLNTLPTTATGRFKFIDFRNDERKLHELFEQFVRNFYKIEQQRFRVRREDITWNFDGHIEHLQFLPKMQTDITLENAKEKIIVDTKFYKSTLQNHRNTEKIHSAHLYQLYSYLKNQEDGTSKTQSAKGVLLYPVANSEYQLRYKFNQHQIAIETIDLNVDWKRIHKKLLQIIND